MRGKTGQWGELELKTWYVHQHDQLKREEGSGWGTCVYLWWIHADIWQNQCNIVKLKNKIKLKKKELKLNNKHTKNKFKKNHDVCVCVVFFIPLLDVRRAGKIFQMVIRYLISQKNLPTWGFGRNFIRAIAICSHTSNHAIFGKLGQGLDIHVFRNTYTNYCGSISPALKTGLISSCFLARQSCHPSVAKQDTDETLPPSFAEAASLSSYL